MADILLIAGLSGAGRSQAADDLEDVGWFVVDNMPIALIDKVVELAATGEQSQLALVVGAASRQGMWFARKPASAKPGITEYGLNSDGMFMDTVTHDINLTTSGIHHTPHGARRRLSAETTGQATL